jgi:acetyltransferase
VEVFKDRALGFPPLNTTLARRMMEQTRIYKALKGVRGRKPVDLAALEQLMVRFSQLVAEQRLIKEIDINPLLASPERLLALDARIVLHNPDVTEDQVPGLAVRPYPIQYVQPWTTKEGKAVTIRPIRPEDEPLMIRFHETLSERSVYMRYFNELKLSQRIKHERLSRICFIDYDREMALVVEYRNPKNNERDILGVGRLSKLHGKDEAEFAILIADKAQGQGLGKELLRRLVQVAREERIQRVAGHILPDNQAMQHICKELGFELTYRSDLNAMRAEITL